MKSQALPEIPLIGLIGTITIIVGIIMPPSIIKTTIDKELRLTYEYEKLQSTLLTFLSSTHDGKNIYDIIIENVNTPENLEFLEADLDRLIKSTESIEYNCFSLEIGRDDSFNALIENGACEKKFTFTTLVPLPYNSDSDSRLKLLRIGVG